MKNNELTSVQTGGKITGQGRVLPFLGNALTVLAASFCCLGCVMSAYSMPDSMFITLLPVLLISSAIVCALAVFLRYKGLVISLILPLALFLFNGSGILSGYKRMAYVISSEYSRWFPIPVFFGGRSMAETDVLPFFITLGVVLVVFLALAVCVRHSATFVFVLTFPIVLISLILVDFPPNPWYLAGTIAVYLSLVVGSALHPEEPEKRGRVVFPALWLSALFLGLAYFIAAPQTHDRAAFIAYLDNALEGIVVGESSNGLGWPAGVTTNWRFNTSDVEISGAGERKITGQEILEVTSDMPGTFYLYGYAMSSFDGSKWTGNSRTLGLSYEDSSHALPASIIALSLAYSRSFSEIAPVLAQGHMTITEIGDSSGLEYQPYYSYNTAPAVSNNGSGDSYDVDFNHIEGSLPQLAEIVLAEHSFSFALDYSNYFSRVQELYTQVDPATAEGLREIALEAGIDPGADRETIANQVAVLVSASARYTLSPAAIPAGEDFALYFLQNSRQGYCIHFATAATLMLRSLDIPARFASGFAVTVPEAKAGQAVTVTDRQAHSWVEVFYDGLGWVPLEVTPAGALSPFANSSPSPESASTPPSTNPAASPSVSPSPSPSISGEKEKTGGFSWVLVTAAVLVLMILALILRRRLASAKRDRDFKNPDANAAAISAWRYISRLHKRGSRPPEAIEALALKARFSQHRLSQEECALVTDYALALAGETDKNCNFLQRLWLRYFRGLY